MTTMGRAGVETDVPNRAAGVAAAARRRRRTMIGAALSAAAAALFLPGAATVASALVVPTTSRGGIPVSSRGSVARCTPSCCSRPAGGRTALFTSSPSDDCDGVNVPVEQSTTATECGGKHGATRGGSGLSRRSVVLRLASLPVGAAAVLATTGTAAEAAKPEIDKSGQLFSPKAAMIGGGGSDAARGIKLTERDRSSEQTAASRGGRSLTKGAGLIQEVYDARFISYLSRFLLNNDPAAKGWWLEQVRKDEADYADKSDSASALHKAEQLRFAEFAESVEVGLADYFVGPYGSYASVQAAKAGLRASAPATSKTADSRSGFLPDVLGRVMGGPDRKQGAGSVLIKKKRKGDEVMKLERQGVLNLFTLLKARYTTRDEKKQLAILFSLMSDPRLQPTDGVRSLLGEVDDGSITRIELDGVRRLKDDSNFRESSREGGGYSLHSPPEVMVEPPPALGTGYKPARVAPVMQRTSRVLRVNVTDGGEGYEFAPSVTITQRGVRRQCDACAVLDREGRVESVVILDPGFGYGGGGSRRNGEEPVLPTVEIEAPRKLRRASAARAAAVKGGSRRQQRKQKDSGDKTTMRTATAVAELEYAITDVKILDEGNGYVTTQPPKVSISPPESDPDWFLSRAELAPKRQGEDDESISILASGTVEARVTSMRKCFPNVLVDTSTPTSIRSQMTLLDENDLLRVRGDSLGLLPSAIRPELIKSVVFSPGLVVTPSEGGTFHIPLLPDAPSPIGGALPSPRYRAYDPLFGGVGTKPVTKGARDLNVGEYSRLALSGAVCTVVVRTLLNPLELVKTKIQLENDEELNEYAAALAPAASASSSVSAKGKSGGGVNATDEGDSEEEAEASPPGTLAMIRSLVELRGPLSLFQSADITFLASLMFGSFGFGATELFRRSFSMIFFDEGGGSGTGTELVLLLAAAVACVITCLAATPFEMVRVKSMSFVEPKGWTQVLAEFLDEKRQDRMKVAMAGPVVALSPERVASTSEALKVYEPEPGAESSVAVAPVKHSEHTADVSPSPPREVPEFNFKDLQREDIAPLWGAFAPIVSRELPFAITKFLVFDLLAQLFVRLVNAQMSTSGALEPVQVGVGPTGLAISALAGALAGIAGAFISHPADLILTLTSAAAKKSDADDGDEASSEDESEDEGGGTGSGGSPDWRPILKDLLSKEGGVGNLFAGLPARSLFFFLVIGLQFFLYDYVKGLFRVGSDDLTLVLDVFYAIRQGLVNMDG